MTEDDILKIFREYSALLEGHFILSSGLHSNRYIQCALVLQHPRVAEQLCVELGPKLGKLGAKTVVAPALGGVIVGHEVARALGLRALFTERQNGEMPAARLSGSELSLTAAAARLSLMSPRLHSSLWT
jgi:orotate phosphoribosyltransferase